MDAVSKGIKGKKSSSNLITKTWKRCKSIGRGSTRTSGFSTPALTVKSKSWPRMRSASALEKEDEDKRRQFTKRRIAPEGCFSVYVGPDKQRFFIKTEYVNHPLFKILLEEAESEYGFNCGGPLELPCDVAIFKRVLMAMDDDHKDYEKIRRGCGLVKSPSLRSYRLLSPSRIVTMNQLI